MGSFFRAITILAFAAHLHAQPPTFEVATIKLSNPDTHGGTRYNPSGARFAVANMTLKDLIALAWDIQGFQIFGGPNWIDSAHYDIVAKAERPADLDQVKPMLQTLLADRFQLTLHHSTKEMSVYVLVTGKNKPKLHPSDAAAPQLHGRNGRLWAEKIPLSTLAAQLSDRLGRPVLDHTGLTGDFDISLQWNPDDIKPQSNYSRPSIFTAIHDQLGLKLEAQKAPTDILIVDRAERPSDN